MKKIIFICLLLTGCFQNVEYYGFSNCEPDICITEVLRYHRCANNRSEIFIRFDEYGRIIYCVRE